MIDLLTTVLAAYRLTRMLMVEDGPCDVFLRLREQVYARFDENHWINKGFSCPFCLSVWAALFVVFCLPKRARLALAGAAVAPYLVKWEFEN